MRWQEILDRFRPVAAPGGAAESAEHVAERSGAALELTPVFAALDGDLAAAADLVETAQAQAAGRIEEARDRAAALVARARMDAPGLKASAAAAVLADAADEDERVIRAARERVDELLASRTPRLDATAGAVIDRLLDGLRIRS